jgi:beta-lactamase regulating signal transducer with metallopeptidase domain
MIAWVLYAVLVGLCVVAAAAAADVLARMRGISVRYVWIVAALLCVALPATARLRANSAKPVVRDRIDMPLDFVRASFVTVERRVPMSVAMYSVVAWAIAIGLVTMSFAVVYARLRRASRMWPEIDLLGQRVRVSAGVGPVVIGVLRPEIIVPRWVLDRSRHEQRLILAHEAEHVRAGDPIILGAACALVAMMPWNPATWIILSRLRLAIEIDCDARVLRGGVSPHAYGSLLVEVAERASPLRFAMALSDSSSHLHQRILAMSPRSMTHPIGRVASVMIIGLVSLLAACEAKMPTAAEIDRMDATSVERNVRALGIMKIDSSVLWSVDGVRTTAAVAKAIPADSIVTVSISGPELSGSSQVYVVTKRGQQLALERSGEAGLVRRRATGQDPIVALTSKPEQEQPTIMIDGVKATAAAMKALDRSRITNIDIIKGASAIREYGDDAKNGMIIIKMKPVGAP